MHLFLKLKITFSHLYFNADQKCLGFIIIDLINIDLCGALAEVCTHNLLINLHKQYIGIGKYVEYDPHFTTIL